MGKKLKKAKPTKIHLGGVFGGVIILFLFLFFNIFLSQKISPFYFNLVNEDKKAAVEFLEKIKKLPEFNQELEKYKTIYGKIIESEVFAKDRERKQMMKNLEQILEKNPKARDVLYSLFLLYNRSGEQKKSLQYLQRAKAVDPMIK